MTYYRCLIYLLHLAQHSSSRDKEQIRMILCGCLTLLHCGPLPVQEEEIWVADRMPPRH